MEGFMSLDDFFNQFGGIKKTTKDAPKKEPMTVDQMFTNSVEEMMSKNMKDSSWYDKKKNVVVPKVGIYKLFDIDKKDGFTVSDSEWKDFCKGLLGQFNNGSLKTHLDIIGKKQKEAIEKRRMSIKNKKD
jgi:hypothetical protein